jgi:hypothetical protein
MDYIREWLDEYRDTAIGAASISIAQENLVGQDWIGPTDSLAAADDIDIGISDFSKPFFVKSMH